MFYLRAFFEDYDYFAQMFPPFFASIFLSLPVALQPAFHFAFSLHSIVLLDSELELELVLLSQGASLLCL